MAKRKRKADAAYHTTDRAMMNALKHVTALEQCLRRVLEQTSKTGQPTRAKGMALGYCEKSRKILEKLVTQYDKN